MNIYYPYPANDGKHKYFIYTPEGKKISFGAFGMSDYTIHKDIIRKEAYIKRHKKGEDWNNPNTAGYWSKEFLWSYPTKEEAYKKIKDKLLKWRYITKEQYNSYVF